MRQLVIHSLKMRKVQSISIALSVMLSVMILVTFGLVYGGVMQGVNASAKQGGADVMAVPSDSLSLVEDTDLLYTGAPAPIYMSDDIVTRLQDCDGSAQVSPQFFGQTLTKACCSSLQELRLIGIDTQTDFVVSGLIDEDIVRNLDENSVIVGSEVDGVNDGQFKVYGTAYNVVGYMASTGTEFDYSIVMCIDKVRDLSRTLEGYEKYWEQYGDPSHLVSCVMVDAVDDEDGAGVTAVQGRIRLSEYASPIVRTEVVDKSQAQLKSVFMLLAIAAGIMLVVTLLQLFARFYSTVWERKSELALYRAIGASKGDLKKLIFGEMGALVGSGLVVGVILGFVAQFALLSIMQDGLSFPYMALGIPACALLVVAVIVIFAIVCLISIAWPLSQIGRLDPSAAMQQGDID